MFSYDIQQALGDMLSGMVTFLPKLIITIILLVGGKILAEALFRVTSKSLKKLGIDKYDKKLNEIDLLSKNNIRVELSKIFGWAIKYIVLLIFVMTAVGVLDLPVLAELIQDFIKFLPNLIAAFIILIVGLLLASFLQKTVTTAGKSLGLPSANIIGIFVFYFVFINIIIAALAQAQVNTDFFAQNISIIIAGGVLAFSIGYGFASKDLVASFLASTYTKGKINVGEKVSFNGVTGVISHIDKSSVTISTDQKDIIIPLHKMFQENIEIYKK
ncbi:MAG: mechanosensitive ion channel [Saprospiraceae bacterium]|nr:mechanosensitive ion channel [Saprospiraceae bacterium]MCZ2339980.1 mechanosensitive ion channel [Chitinophagales bacterium]